MASQGFSLLPKMKQLGRFTQTNRLDFMILKKRLSDSIGICDYGDWNSKLRYQYYIYCFIIVATWMLCMLKHIHNAEMEISNLLPLEGATRQ